jgi:ketosteroid isomerase-like protein
MADSRPDSNSCSEENLALVERYFEAVAAGDPTVADLFSEDARWIAPQSSPVGRHHDGKSAVLELMSSGVGLYDTSHPMDIQREAAAAMGEHVFVELTIEAKTGQGEDYRNHYVFVFRIRGGMIVEVHEHLDTLYAQRLLFDPVGQKSPLDAGG